MSLARRTLALVTALTVVLAAMIAERAFLLASSTTVLLRTAPIDPTSLFRGDYVILNYDISRLDLDSVAGDDDFRSGDTAFVTLEPQGEFWTAAAVHHSRPDPGPGRALIRGTVNRSVEGNASASAALSLDYGIESYFVPEGQGKAVETAMQAAPPRPEGLSDRPRPLPDEAGRQRQHRVTIEVALSDRGKAAIKTLFLDGAPYHREKLF